MLKAWAVSSVAVKHLREEEIWVKIHAGIGMQEGAQRQPRYLGFWAGFVNLLPRLKHRDPPLSPDSGLQLPL